MSADATTQSVLFPDLFAKPVWASFDREHGSSDGGAVLLAAAERPLGLMARLVDAVRDDRQSAKVRHELGELLRQRIFAIACGYPDGNDAARLADDPIHKLLVGRDPVAGAPLGSQPTMSRFENSVGPRDLLRLGEAIADTVIERHRRRLRGRARLLTLDLDPTDDPTHGAQQLSFFNGHYHTWCYLPVLGFLRFNDEPEQYLVAAVLRPGNAPAKAGAVALLRRLLPRLRHAFPRARFRVRLDGGFASPEVLDFLDAEPRLEYLVAVAKNSVLKRRVARSLGHARRLSRQSGQTVVAHVV